MGIQDIAILEHIRDSYENREAIYVEKGALRVRVHNIQIDTHRCKMEAEVEELFTPGLGAGIFYKPVWNEGRPRRWSIAGDLTSCFDVIWMMGYGGWALCFARPVVDGVVALAAQWPTDLDPRERYSQVVRWLGEYNVYDPQPKRLFPE
jgi:hypothetical protein